MNERARPGDGPATGEHLEVRRGTYRDSVSLMSVSSGLADLDGVDAAMVAMGTALNLELLAGMGFDVAAAGEVGPNDLVIAVRARDGAALADALARADEALAKPGPPGEASGGWAPAAPRTVASAARRGEHLLALVSVPGEHAFTEAADALANGLNVMVFSDNVPVEQEVLLKRQAAERGLLVMGPDCGTAVVNGVGLGFANVVRPGPVGIVAASGTGAQQVCCLLDAGGAGVRHVLGVGGRDLSEAVGGASTLAALAALDDDPGVEVILVVSKPPAEAVADRVRAAAADCSTPVHLGFVGLGQPDLTAAAGEVLRALAIDPPEPRRWGATGEPVPGRLRGIFAGGTLCDEAMVVAAEALGPVASNIPLRAEWALGPDLRTDGHAMIDFGDDALTRGRPHPMIDNRLRLDRLAAEAADPTCGVVLLDVVLGHAAHPDPAAEIAAAIAEATAAATAAGRRLAVVVSLCGSEGDPQGLERQAAQLAAAGASVHQSNADAARTAAALSGADR